MQIILSYEKYQADFTFTLMQNQSLLEVLSLDRKILEKPPNWNLPVQEELFSPLLL